jgi:hypothetical protein
MDIKIYITGLALMATWLLLEELKTVVYGFYMKRKVMTLLDELDDRELIKPAAMKKRTPKKK